MSILRKLYRFWLSLKASLRIATRRDYEKWISLIDDKSGTGQDSFDQETKFIDAWLSFEKRQSAGVRPSVEMVLKMAEFSRLKTATNRLIIAWASEYGVKTINEILSLSNKVDGYPNLLSVEAHSAIKDATQAEEALVEVAPFYELYLRARENSYLNCWKNNAEEERFLKDYRALSVVSVEMLHFLISAISSFVIHHEVIADWISRNGINSTKEAVILAGNIIPIKAADSEKALEAYCLAAEASDNGVAKDLARLLKKNFVENPCLCLTCQINQAFPGEEEKKDRLLKEAERFDEFLKNNCPGSGEEHLRLAKEFGVSDELLPFVERQIAHLSKPRQVSRFITITISGKKQP